jgi:3-oxoacyl-[acyl-carrier protein] reductase
MKVVLVDIDQNQLDRLSEELEGKTYPIALDVSDPAQVEEAVKEIEREFGEVDILVNNAGILFNNKVLATTPEEWRKVLSVNLDGAFYLSKAVIPAMKKKKWGRIINVTSLAAKTGGITAGTAYSVSKGGLISLTFSLAAETASYGITVNGIAPAYVKTPMITEQLTEEQRQTLLKKIPVGRFCEPEEFAHVVRFLVHPLAGFITGEIIDQNGGLMFD